jgi:myosin heavy subunit
MFDGLSYLIVQIVVLLLVALALGFLLGRLLRPRRSEPVALAPLAAEPVTETVGPSTTELKLFLEQAQSQIMQLRDQLTTSEAESLRLRTKIRVLADEKETEMGRLESGAIVALESAISQNQELVTELEAKLSTAERTVRETEELLDAERRRSAQLQKALAERDQLLATLTADQGTHPGIATPGPNDPLT